MHADIVETGFLALQLSIVLLDQLEGRIRDFLVVVPPLPHQALWIVVYFRGV